MHFTLRYFLSSLLMVVALASITSAADAPWALPTLLQRVPPLQHDATGRLPMICIAPFLLTKDDQSYAQAKPLPPEMIRELVKRGLTQSIPPRVEYIPYALALQKEGAKVIMFEGNAFNGPPGDMPDGLHHLPADFKRDPDQPAQQPHYPCPLLFEGWQKSADGLRATMRKFKEAGVTVDAVWLDWEIEPYPGKSQWNEARACSRCRTMFPPGVLDSFERYSAFITRLRNNLFSTYAAAPILEVFPKCSVTNWELVYSSPERPTASWGDTHRFPPADLGMFNTANPVVYGNTLWYKEHWKAEWNWPLDIQHMDRVYTQVMLQQISDHAANAQKLAPEALSVPWVDRYCVDDPDETIPILSRERYREILRHVWLRGATSMQIFNNNWYPNRPERVTIMTEEVEDAVKIYDEMLAYRPFLERGEIMNTASPAATDDGPIWSGLRLGDTAVVRTFTQGAHPVTVNISPFAGGPSLTLDCPPQGATYLLKREGNTIDKQVEKL